MAIPAEHIRKMYLELAPHQERIVQLVHAIRAATDELECHQVVVRLATNPGILATVDDAVNNEELLRRLQAGGSDVAEIVSGLPIPSDGEVFGEERDGEIVIGIRFANRRFPFVASYSNRVGFNLTNLGREEG